ncbi:MAG: hypothetical protein ABSF84_13540 [Acidimicrobiales bacterium]|jgi:hypothetical protein
MGETPGDPGIDGSRDGAVLVDEAPPIRAESPERVVASPDPGRRRFTVASLVGVVVAALPFLWILWGTWEPPSFFRKLTYEANFYDLQTRAMFHGGLAIPKGSIGVEGFVVGGRTYTYFGLFPSVLRMPILAVTHSFDGRLTAPSILLAWLVTAAFFVPLCWRVRLLVRGDAPVGWAEAASFGVLTTTFLGGSVFLLLGAVPYVFSEDLAWSVALTVGSIFCLLGVVVRPSWGRVVASGGLMICANQDRSTTGWATVVGAVLIAGWFLLGKGGEERRRWWLPVAAAGGIALLLGCAVNYAKFGALFGLPIKDQVYSMTNAYRQRFLAANHDSEVGTAFIPSNLLAYLRPDGIEFSSVFPFITLPASPAPALGGVLFDRLYRTASVTASMPLLSGLSIWGLVTAFRPHPVAMVSRTRLLLLAAGSAGAALMLWGYIAPRYLADFLPFLAIGSAVGLADVWRRQDGRTRGRRVMVAAVIGVVALYSLVANIGIAVTPVEEWNTTQALGYVQFQKSVSDLTGGQIRGRVVRGDGLPTYAPAGRIRIVGACDGMYISNGEDYTVVPSSQSARQTWQTVEYGPGFQRLFYVTPRDGTSPARVDLVQAGLWTISVETEPLPGGRTVSFRIAMAGAGGHAGTVYRSYEAIEPVGGTHRLTVLTDPYKHVAQVSIDDVLYLNESLVDGAPVDGLVTPSQASATNPISVVDATASTPEPSLCLSLLGRAS